MKKLLTLSLLLLCGILLLNTNTFAQQLDVEQPEQNEFNFGDALDFNTDIPVEVQYEYDFMNGYKYIYMPRIQGSRKMQEIYDFLKKEFAKKGLRTLSKKFRFWNPELKDNPGMCLYFKFKMEENKEDKMEFDMNFQNVNSETIKEMKYTSETDDDRLHIKDVLEQFKKDFGQLKYKFDEKFFVKLSYAELEQINKNMKMVNNYFNKKNISYSNLHPVEGMYARSTFIPLIGKRLIDEKVAFIKSYQAVTPDNVPEWVLQDDELKEALADGFPVARIKVIVTNNINRIWNAGEVKADLFVYEQDDEDYTLRGEWFFDNKKSSMVNLHYNGENRRFKMKEHEYQKIK